MNVGAPTITVACSSRMAVDEFLRVSSGLGTVTTWQLRKIGYQIVAVQPKLWKTGRHAIIVALSGRIARDEIWAQLAMMFAMREHHALGLAGAAAGEQQDGLVVSPTSGRPSSAGTIGWAAATPRAARADGAFAAGRDDLGAQVARVLGPGKRGHLGF